MSRDSHAPSPSGPGAEHHSLSVLSTTHSPGDVVAAIDDRSTTSRVHAVCGTGCRGHVRVCATVENTGDAAGGQSVALDAGGLGSDATTVSLNGGESTSVALSVATGAGDAGAYATSVSSADEAAGS